MHMEIYTYPSNSKKSFQEFNQMDNTNKFKEFQTISDRYTYI